MKKVKNKIIDKICVEYNKGQDKYTAERVRIGLIIIYDEKEITPINTFVDFWDFFFNPRWKFLESIFNRQKFYASYMELEIDFMRAGNKVKFLKKILEV